MRKIMLHIPHSSLFIPNEYLNDYLIDYNLLKAYNIEMSDIHTDKIFEYGEFHCVRFNYSRLFCDVEKFTDPELEPLAKFGMGPIYTNVYDGTLIRSIGENKSKLILDEFYKAHHQQLDSYAEKTILEGNVLLVIDCHSYLDKMVSKLFGVSDFPDLCIGFDEKYKDEHVIDIIKSIFEANGYSVMFNFPFQGALVPNIAFSNDKIAYKVKSVMIELNKRTYLDSSNQIDYKKFNKLRKVILSIYKKLV